MKVIHIISFVLVVVGGLSWGLVGLGVGDVVTQFLGEGLAKIVFILVGIAAVIEVVTHKKSCRACSMSGASNAL